MNRIINGVTYSLGVTLYWGSDNKDIESNDLDGLNASMLLDDKIQQLDIISSLSVPFVYGSFIYRDSKTNSQLMNLIDMPLIHGKISFFMVEGTDIPGGETVPKAHEEEYFVEDVFITGIETIDKIGEDLTLVKFNFASEDILKFTANIEAVSTFDKGNSDKESDNVNDVIKMLFGAAKLSEKLDNNSFTANVGKKIKFINSSNDNLLSSLEYVYRKTYDDNFKESKDCSYARVIYNHTTHKYVQWKYEDVGTKTNFSNTEVLLSAPLRDKVIVDLGKPTEPNSGGGRFFFNNSGNYIESIESIGCTRFIDYNYKKNEFEKFEFKDNIEGVLVKHKDELDDTLVTRNSIIKNKGDKFKDTDYIREFTTSQQNGSIYDVITDSIFDNNYYRVESKGSIGRKVGDSIYIEFSNSVMSMYENMDGDYLITAIDNRFNAADENGGMTFKSIMDVHRPYTASDSTKINHLK